MNTATPNDDVFFDFVEQVNTVAAEIKVILRAEQLAVMFLLTDPEKHTNLLELSTGSGKSMMLGILAVHLNNTTEKKVIVVVPSKVLSAY